MYEGRTPCEPVDWRVLAGEASAHGVEIALFSWLRPVLCEEARRWFDLRCVASRALHERRIARLLEVLAALEDAGVPCAVLKGPVQAERFHTPPYGRPSSDMDILIEPAKLDAACTALASVGYAIPDLAMVPYYLAVHHHLVLKRPDSEDVELHFFAQSSFGVRLPASEFLAGVVGFQVAAGAWIRVLGPVDNFVFLSVHAAAGYFRFGHLGWTHDLVLVSRAGHLHADLVRARARALGVERAVVAALHVIQAIGAPMPGTPPIGFRGRIARAMEGEYPKSLQTAISLASQLVLADDAAAVVRQVRWAAFKIRWRPPRA